MPKPIIAVDLDDVLGDQKEAVRQFINNKYGVNHTSEDYDIEAPYWGFWEKVWGVDVEEGRRRFDEFVAAGGGLKQNTIPDAIEVITELEKNYRLVIVTARREELTDETHMWLERHFPKVFHAVKFVPMWGDDNKRTKADICKEVGAGYLIDDHLSHCQLAAESGITALLFGEYGWNQASKLPKNVHRVKDWRAVKKFFDERSE